MVITIFWCKYKAELFVFYSFLSKKFDLIMAKEKIINIRVDAEMKRQAKKLAENDGRSLSNWILRLIQTQIEKSNKLSSRKKD